MSRKRFHMCLRMTENATGGAPPCWHWGLWLIAGATVPSCKEAVEEAPLMNNGHARARWRSRHHIDLTVRQDRGRWLFDEAPWAFCGYVRVKQEAALHVWDLSRDGQVAGGVALRAAQSERRHDRYSAGLHHLAFHAADRADVDRAHALMEEQGATIVDPPAE